jgi:hypothetical protein
VSTARRWSEDAIVNEATVVEAPDDTNGRIVDEI